MPKGNSAYNVVQEMLDKTKEEVEKIHPINILVAGKTGVGKSTLINNVFRERLAETGVGRPVTKHLRRIAKEGVPIVLYDTRGLELSEAIQAEVKTEIMNTIKESQKKGSEERIHIVYYCINAGSSRIEESEMQFIDELAKLLPVLVVLTQSIGQPANELKKYIENQNLHVAGVIAIIAEPYPITDELVLPRTGLKELIEITFALIPEETKPAFNNAQQVDIARKAKAARSWATKYITTTFGVGFTPIPFSDATILVPMQVGMLAHITAIFGISMDKATITSIIGAIGGTSGATYLGRYIVSNLLKLIPGAGTIAGGLISGVTAAMLTTALAMSYIEVLTIIAKGEKDGKYPDLSNIEALMREKMQERLKKGKKNSDTKAILERIKSNPLKKLFKK